MLRNLFILLTPGTSISLFTHWGPIAEWGLHLAAAAINIGSVLYFTDVVRGYYRYTVVRGEEVTPMLRRCWEEKRRTRSRAEAAVSWVLPVVWVSCLYWM